jgi:hypothetical protein
MREGMVWHSFSKPKSKPGIPSIPSSISPVQVHQPSCVQPQLRGWAVDVCDPAEVRPADLTSRRERGLDDRVTRFPTSTLTVGNPSERCLGDQALPRSKDASSAGYRRSARRALEGLAAARAVTVGK